MSSFFALLGCSGTVAKDKPPPEPADATGETGAPATETTPPSTPPTGETASTGDTGPTTIACSAATEEEFREAFHDKFCFGWSQCNTGGGDCPLDAGGGTTTYGPCNYDAVVGEQCVCTDEWGCNDDFPGLEFVLPPRSCDHVCG